MVRAGIFGTLAVMACTFASPAFADGEANPPPAAPAPPPAAPAPPPAAPTPPPATPTEIAPPIVPTSSPTMSAPPPPPRMSLPESSDERPHRTRWYGWQILISDGLATALLFAAADTNNRRSSETMLELAGAVYLAGPAVVHFAHGSVGRGFASPAIRFGMPIVSGGLGCILLGGGDNGDAFACLGGAIIGGMLGVGGAIAVDVAALAHEPAPTPTGISFAPRASVTKEGFSLGLAAAF